MQEKHIFFSLILTKAELVAVKWEDIDEVMYGPYGKIHNMYCLSWDDLSGFEDINEEYKETKKNGVHKTYTVDDVEKLIDEAFED